jgi:diguanylate cyclase (GGDEF)-like protein/PAS domain S-box-containing protein
VMQHDGLNKLILDSAGEGILGLDIKGNHTFINLAAAKMLGYEVDDLIGKPSHSTWHYKKPDGSPYPGHECPIYKALKDGVLQRIGNEVFWKKDGTNFPVEYTTTPIQEEGKIIGTVIVFNDITARKQAEEKIAQLAKEWQSTFDSITDLVSIQDSNCKLVRVNKAYADVFQKKPEELAGQICYEVVHKTSCPIDNCPHERALKTKEGTTSEIFEPVLGLYLEISCSPIFDEQGEMKGTIHIAKNITERKKSEEALERSEDKYRSIFEHALAGIYQTSPEGRLLTTNNAFARMFGYGSAAELLSEITDVGAQLYANPEDRKDLISILHKNGIAESLELKMRHRNGSTFWISATIRVLKDQSGMDQCFEGICTDITERKKMEQKLEEMATHDYLTGLPNRVLLEDRFTIAAALVRRNKSTLAVMSLDLDKFKTINDSLGHEAGDKVLKGFSARLSGIIRASDTIARIGGDEFILLMLEARRREDATAIAQKILDSCKEPLFIDSHQLHISTSIGIAIYPEDAEDMETLIKKSDAAMYYSKGHGRNQFKFFSDGDVLIGGDHKSSTTI